MKFSFQRSNVFSLHHDTFYSGGAYYFKAAPSLRDSCTSLIAETILVHIVHILFQTLLCFTEQTCMLCKSAYPPLQIALRGTEEQVSQLGDCKSFHNSKEGGRKRLQDRNSRLLHPKAPLYYPFVSLPEEVENSSHLPQPSVREMCTEI